ncbi:MAG: hypothetical protein D6683_08005 [Actinomyces sp.]|nr:MAG: hypothetical protein D6683_08005 [Actinomyces sp.]
MRRSRPVPVLAVVVGVVALFTGLAPLGGGPPPAAAQRQARLDLVAQTTWVGDSPPVVDLRVIGAPADAHLEIRLYAPPRRRAAFVAGLDGSPPGRIDGMWRLDDLGAAAIGAGDVVSVVVPDVEIGELLRSRPGAHPLVIDLVAGDDVLDRLVTHLLVVRSDPEDVPLDVAVLTQLSAPLAIDADGTRHPDPDAVAALADRALVLAAHPDVPVTVDVRAETLASLAATGDTATLEGVAAALDGAVVTRAAWVDLDEPAWLLADGRDVVDEQYARAATTLDTTLGRSAGPVSLLDGDAGPATLSALGDLGVTSVLVDADRLGGLDAAIVDDTVTHPVELADADGGRLGALPLDTGLAEAVAGGDPELAAHRVLAELTTIALTRPDRARGLVVDARSADVVTLDLLLAGLRTATVLRPVTAVDLTRLPPARVDGPDGEGPTLVADLRPGPVPDLRLALFDRRLTTARLDAFASLIEPTGGLDTVVEPLAERIAAADDRSLPDRSRAAYLAAVRAAIDDAVTGVRIVDTGRVTLTAHRASVPLTIANERTQPLAVLLALDSEKLRFPEGAERVVLLEPGVNELAVLVDAPGTGDARLRVTLRSPRGDLVVADAVIDIRSTALSGIGLAITVVALGVLASWWIRSVLRGRRQRPAASVGAPDGAISEEDPT